MDSTNTGGVEYPDEAGYPDGEGTLDEGTGAFREGDAVSGVEVEVEVPQGVDQLDEFDGPDERDE
ncbi:hypothetical protein [Leifsonia sp. 71-9]|uniref:hypothetical protein n=1 Tax=Leifsonia sp. 71-9 TaxID=1895934 RepID=UPI00092C2BC5|nr:hypothetical protein [Leifsonia sp. 71-9]OJX72483.1 MAG: hypothetical protein BGO91_01540 [Leifsonia sp. 71-9]